VRKRDRRETDGETQSDVNIWLSYKYLEHIFSLDQPSTPFQQCIAYSNSLFYLNLRKIPCQHYATILYHRKISCRVCPLLALSSNPNICS
jgi:hypothetical protein